VAPRQQAQPEESSMSNNEDTFFVVWNPQGRSPMVRHVLRASAILEAERLARTCRGQEFIVLSAVESRKVNDMVITQYMHEIPF
jgi:hypothetical protein